MTYSLTGFSAAQNVQVQNAIALACEATDVAYKAMTAVRKTGIASQNYQDFFGPTDIGRIDKVWKKINMIHYAMINSSVKYLRNTGRPKVYAAAQRPLSDWSEKDVRQILDKNEFSVKIDDMFYGQGTDRQLAALTIVHEVSHLVANTDDVDCPWDNRACYGLDRCRRMADRYADQATENADSYGFYVMREHRSAKTPDLQLDFDPDLSAFFSQWHAHEHGTTP